jgi:two-component system, NarL family, response regulator NreC
MPDISVLLVDDHRVIRSGLRMLLEAAGGIDVVAEAGTIEDAVIQARACRPHVIVLDLQLGDESGLKLFDSLKMEPMPRVLVLTMHESDEYLWAALKLGAAGYVLKKSADVDLVTAIHTVVEGGTYVDGTMASSLVSGEPHEGETNGDNEARQILSDRELQVGYRVALGYTNAEIGRELYLSVKTVETYRSRAMTKLGISTRAELVRYALQEGWFEEGEVAVK